jgi:FG-GAP-like repeat
MRCSRYTICFRRRLRRSGELAFILRAVIVGCVAVCIWGVGDLWAQTNQATPSANAAAKAAAIVFENVVKKSGIGFTLKNSVSPHRYSIETMTGGVALFDYDNDGLLDIFFTNGAAIPSLEKTDASFSNRLFHNNGDGTFTDVTERAAWLELAIRWALLPGIITMMGSSICM